jgi:hypothetical protein
VYRQLVDDNQVSFDAPMTAAYDDIRHAIAPDGNRIGLENEAIRKVISPIFKQHKSASKSCP